MFPIRGDPPYEAEWMLDPVLNHVRVEGILVWPIIPTASVFIKQSNSWTTQKLVF